MRWRACQLHRRQGGRRKQQESKFGHVMSVPSVISVGARAMNRYALGRNVAVFKRWLRFISAVMQRLRAPVHGSFRLKFQRLGLEDQAGRSEAVRANAATGRFGKRGVAAHSIGGWIRRRGASRPMPRRFLRHLAGQFPWWVRRARLGDRRWNLGIGIAHWIFRRRHGRMARRRRRNLRRLDWCHHSATLRLSPGSGRPPVTAAAAIFT